MTQQFPDAAAPTHTHTCAYIDDCHLYNPCWFGYARSLHLDHFQHIAGRMAPGRSVGPWCPGAPSIRYLSVRYTFRIRYRTGLPNPFRRSGRTAWPEKAAQPTLLKIEFIRSHPLPARKHAFRLYVPIRYCILLHEARSYVLIGLSVGNW